MTDCELEFTHLPLHVASAAVTDRMPRFTAWSCAYKLAKLDHNGLNFSASQHIPIRRRSS
jgi:hypothetical protein